MKYVEEKGKKYKIDNDGEKYRISWSEELQMKNLTLSKRHVVWQRRNFYVKLALLGVICLLTLSILYVFFRLDQVNFFTTLMMK